MPSRIRQLSHSLTNDTSRNILIIMGLMLACIFLFANQYADLMSRALPAIVASLCICLLMVPQRNMTNLLMIAAGISIPFAHFALVVVGGQGIQWIHLFGSLLIIHFLLRLLLGTPFKITPAIPWVLGLVFATLISLLAILSQPVTHVEEFWKSEIQLLFCILFFVAITQARLENKQILFVIKVMIILSLLVAIFGLYQLPARFFGWPGGVLSLTNPSLSGLMQSVGNIFYMVRVSSIFSEPSYLGHYLVVMIALTLTAVLHKPRLFVHSWILWVALVIQAIGLIVSAAMSGFYALSLLMLIFLAVERKPERRKIFFILAIIGIVGAIALIIVSYLSDFPVYRYIYERILGIFQYATHGGDKSFLIATESAHQRVDTSNIALKVWWDNAIIGVGLGSYTLVSALYGDYNMGGFAASTLVNTLAETGIIGFSMLIGITGSLLANLWKLFHVSKIDDECNPDSEIGFLPLLARMIFYVIAVEFIYFQIVSDLFWPGLWYFFGLAGFISIRAVKLKKSSPS